MVNLFFVERISVILIALVVIVKMWFKKWHPVAWA